MAHTTPLPRTIAAIERGIADGLHFGGQCHVSLDGREVADLAIGEARPGVAMTPDVLLRWFSSGKPATAIAIAQLWERGRLALDDPATRFIPEFAAGGKSDVTVRHMLTHTSGFRFVPLDGTWHEVIARICAAPQEEGWIAGESAGYGIEANWYILAEIVRRIDGRPFERYVREEIFGPLGMRDAWVGLPAEAFRAYGPRIGATYRMAAGAAPLEVASGPQREARCDPAAGARGTARDLARMYEMLLAGGTLEGARIVSPQTVEAMTAHHRTGSRDATFNRVMDWGLGFMLNNNRYGDEMTPYGFGRHASPRAYGHGGYVSSVAFADPERRLAVAVIVNGLPAQQDDHVRLFRQITASIYEDLGIGT